MARRWFEEEAEPAGSEAVVAARGASSRARPWQELVEALFPPLCWLCRGAPAVDGYGCALHAPSESALDPDEARCSGCADRLPRGITTGLCATCRRTARGYTKLVAFGTYRRDAPLRDWILALKHGGRRDLARPLGALLAAAWQATGASIPVVLVPVPLHPLRCFERGHDQAALLAREVAERLRLECVPALRRRRFTAPQGAPGASSRAANVAGAFALDAGRARRLAGRSLVLVDDVVTSGATVRACAETLRELQPAAIAVLALARVEREDERDSGDRLAGRASADEVSADEEPEP